VNDTWRFIVVITLIFVLGALLPFAADAAAVHFLPASVD
jgi:hypothetical protein